MGFLEKIRKAVRKIRTKLIVYTAIVLILIVWLIAPLCTAIIEAEAKSGLAKWTNDPFNSVYWEEFLTRISAGITNPLAQLGKCFSPDYFFKFSSMLKGVFLIYIFFALIGIIRAIPKHEYEDIENGSSDWSENGEQYKVLSKTKGIVLAEKNYLPVDKRGNVNVLVVRRFWCW